MTEVDEIAELVSIARVRFEAIDADIDSLAVALGYLADAVDRLLRLVSNGST